jgi:hypothetical protein
MKTLIKCNLFLILIGFTFPAHAQELLDADKIHIEKYLASQNGILKIDRIIQDGINPGPYNLLLYSFPKSQAEATDIYLRSFFILHGKCYKYIAEYRSNKFLNSLISTFDDSRLGLERIGNSLRWKNAIKKYEIEIITTKRFDGQGKEVNTTAFILDIHHTSK